MGLSDASAFHSFPKNLRQARPSVGFQGRSAAQAFCSIPRDVQQLQRLSSETTPKTSQTQTHAPWDFHTATPTENRLSTKQIIEPTPSLADCAALSTAPA
mmetsp:Transcript_33937/g.72348  ORF Transcript_33937/g.72348 Transcript_33937/m.72348 type:complete len:100 (+) Transcript_33937:1698-1997(+)